jgi:predicted TIM-barrel fold metal-dependent hydrolase
MGTSANVRARLNHPVIDSDGHIVEFMPALFDYIRNVGGAEIAERFSAAYDTHLGAEGASTHSIEARRDTWARRPSWWGHPTKNSLDRATGSLPQLLYQRAGELGIDYFVLYPTRGMMLPHQNDDELRPVACRAYNEFIAEYYEGEFGDRMTVPGVVPMYTPAEAIAELEHVKAIGLKVVMIAGYVKRPIPAITRAYPKLTNSVTRVDTFGVDSAYDYDPVWAKAVELKLPVVAHSTTMGFSDRCSISNYCYNHMGAFAASGEMLAKSLFMGGVTRRFPELRIGFLEGGVAWACRLFADIVGHWEKRGLPALEENLAPEQLNLPEVLDLFERHGGRLLDGRLDQVEGWLHWGINADVPRDQRDEFAAAGITRVEEIRDRFVPSFYFGCEADDPMNAVAFDRRLNPLGVQLKAMLGSDIGHWDVPDMRAVMEEAYELVEKGLMMENDFRAFTCDNSIELYAGLNRDFFKGTAVEAYAARYLDALKPASTSPVG